MGRSDLPNKPDHRFDFRARRLSLGDSALLATIPALYLGAFALRFWHLLP